MKCKYCNKKITQKRLLITRICEQCALSYRDTIVRVMTEQKDALIRKLKRQGMKKEDIDIGLEEIEKKYVRKE